MNDELKSSFRKELKLSRFEKGVHEFEKQIMDIRNNFIAHLNRNRFPLYTFKGIKWDINSSSTLIKYQQELNRFFDILQFEEKFGLQYAEYDETHHILGDDYQPDIDVFLEQIIRSSRIFNAVEKEPDYWKTIQSRLSKEQILSIIQYREKCGLSNP